MVKDGTWDCGGALIFYIVIVIWASRCEPVFNLLLEFLYIWSHCIHIFFYLLSWHHLIGWSSEVSWSLFLPYDLLILEPPYSWRSIVYFGDTAAVLRCSIMVPFFLKKKKLKSSSHSTPYRRSKWRELISRQSLAGSAKRVVPIVPQRTGLDLYNNWSVYHHLWWNQECVRSALK